MKKDAYYFPHFSNARNDAKIIKLRRVLGLEGYAIYFMLLEVLREQTEFKYPLAGIEDLAFEWHVSREKIQSVIGQFELFQIDENNFFSTKLVLYLQPYLEKSSRASIAANKRWQSVKNQLEEHIENNAKADAKALQMDCISIANDYASKVKESKVKIIKENKESFDFSLFSEIEICVLKNWIEFRKEIKKPVKQSALNLYRSDIDKNGIEYFKQQTENSIKNGWQGLFELKDFKPKVIQSDLCPAMLRVIELNPTGKWEGNIYVKDKYHRWRKDGELIAYT